MMRIVFLAFLSVALAANDPINMRTQSILTYNWLETGFVYLDAATWVSVTTKTLTFQNPVVLVSLPDIPGETNDDGFPTSIRVRNKHFNDDDSLSFELKVYLTNDSFCSKEWYTPVPVDPKLQISWIVAEYGAYNISNYYFFVGTGLLNRTASLYGGSPDFIRVWFPPGCTAAAPEDKCAFPDGDINNIGAVATLQTLVYDRFLMVRVGAVALRFMRFVLNPHDSADSSYYVMHEPETMGYMAFKTGMNIKCVEKLTFETVRFGGVTSTKKFYDFVYTYAYPPGVYGILLTYQSLADSTGLRVFDRDENQCYVITQEDQCVSEPTDHTTPETISILVVGETVTTGTQTCQVRFNSALDSEAPTASPSAEPSSAPSGVPTSLPTSVPTSSPSAAPSSAPTPSTPKPTQFPTPFPTPLPTFNPTFSPTRNPTPSPTRNPTFNPTYRPSAHPTFSPTRRPTGYQTCVDVFLYDLFGDGWGADIALKITRGGDDVTYFTPNCTCDMFPVCFQDTLDLEVVGLASPVRHSWEVLWAVRWPGDEEVLEKVGGFGSSMHFLDDYTFWSPDLLDYTVTDKMQCQRCEHPPPKPPPSGGSIDGTASNSTTSHNDDDLFLDDIVDDIVTDDVTDDETSGSSGPKPAPKVSLVQKHIPFVLFDTEGDGWYNQTTPADTCGNIFPNLFTYPKYYIITKDRARIIHSGTICGDYEKELCHEKLPVDGEFVWRVAGYEDAPEEAAWHFCGADGTIGEELQFKMHKGKCVALAQVSAQDYCEQSVTMATLSGSFVLTGIPNNAVLTKYDTMLIEDQLLDSLHGDEVSLTSWTVKNNVLTINFLVTTCTNALGFNGLFATERESFVEYQLTKLSDALLGGYFVSYVQTSLRAIPNSQDDLFYYVKSATLESLAIDSFYYVQQDGTQISQPIGVYDDDNNDPATTVQDDKMLSFTTPMYVFAAMLCGGMLAVFVVSRALRSRREYSTLDNTEDAVSRPAAKSTLPPQLENEELFYFSNRDVVQRQDSSY